MVIHEIGREKWGSRGEARPKYVIEGMRKAHAVKLINPLYVLELSGPVV